MFYIEFNGIKKAFCSETLAKMETIELQMRIVYLSQPKMMKETCWGFYFI